MRVPQLGWYVGMLAFVAAAVSSVIANRWSEEPLARIRVANAVSASSPESSWATDPERTHAVGHAVWHTAADGQRVPWPAAGRVGNNETVVASGFVAPAEASQAGLDHVESRAAANLSQPLSPHLARASWDDVQSGPPPEPLPKRYPRTSPSLAMSSQSGALPTVSARENAPLAPPDRIEPARRPAGAPERMLDQAALQTARGPALSSANTLPSSVAPQPRLQIAAQDARQSNSRIGDLQAQPFEPLAIGPGDAGRDGARDVSLADLSDQHFDKPDTVPAASIRNGGRGHGFDPTNSARNQRPQPAGAADAETTVGPVQRTHRTGADESLWSISVAYYGRGSYFRALYEHNRRRIVRPDQLEPNLLIEIPSTEELRHGYPALCPAP
jgi:nucleoid-associated protein YgaU